jgi:hypothetical protein
MGGCTAITIQATPRAGHHISRTSVDAAERRQMTVMFCDLVRSAELSLRLDLEHLHAVIGAHHRCCANANRPRRPVCRRWRDGNVSNTHPHFLA